MPVIGQQSPYREVRSLERGLVLLETLARIGWATPTRLARETGIQRSTIYRIMNTLEQLDYVTRREEDGTYFLTSKMNCVGCEVTDEDVEIDIISQALARLVGQIHWPSDFAVLHSGRLTIMASNHRMTTMSNFRGLIGAQRSLVRSALGRALLAAMADDQLNCALELVKLCGGPDSVEIGNREIVEQAIDDTRRRGYGASNGFIDPKFGAIALPVHRARGELGAINIVYYRSAMSCEEAAERYLGTLGASVAEIEQRIAHATVAGHCH